MDSLPFKFNLQIPAMIYGQTTFQLILCRFPPCYMDSLQCNIYSPHYCHATWTAYNSKFILHIHAMLHGQPTFQLLLSTLPHATWTANLSTFTLLITTMLHGQPTFQHLHSTLLLCYMDSVHFNIYSSDFRHSTWTA